MGAIVTLLTITQYTAFRQQRTEKTALQYDRLLRCDCCIVRLYWNSGTVGCEWFLLYLKMKIKKIYPL